MDGGGLIGQKFQCFFQPEQILCRQIGEQAGAVGPQGFGQGGGKQFKILPEKSVPDRCPGRSFVLGRDALGQGGEKTLCFPGAEGLHPAGQAGNSQLFRRQRSGKAHPKHPVPVGDGAEDGRRKGQILCFLGEEECFQKSFPAAGRSGSCIAGRESGLAAAERDQRFPGQAQQPDAVLGGVEIKEQKARVGLGLRGADQ